MLTSCGCSHAPGALPDSLLVSPLVQLEDLCESDNEVGFTVEQVISPYIRDKVAQGIYVQKSARNARNTLMAFSRFVGKRRLGNIGVADIKSWLASMEHLAPATRRHNLSIVRMLFAWAQEKRYCKRNPAAAVRGPKQPRTIPRALPGAAIAAVLEQCPDARARLVVTLMVQQGLRCCEVSRLAMGDIDLMNRTMRVTGKGGHERVLPITEETDRALTDYLAEYPPIAGPLVRSYMECSRSLRPDTISRLVSEWMRDAGIKKRARDGVSAHAGRHSCATDMLRGGAHLRDVQAALGHRFLATTEVYLPLVVHGLAQAMEGRRYRA